MPRSITKAPSCATTVRSTLERVGARLMAARRPPTAMRRSGSNTTTSRIVGGVGRRRLPLLAVHAWPALRWPAAAPVSASPTVRQRPLRPVPGRRLRAPHRRPGLSHRRRWPMAGRTSPPIAPSPSPASTGCARSSTPMPGPAASKAAIASSRRGWAASRPTPPDSSPPSICRPMPNRRCPAPTPLRSATAPRASRRRAANSACAADKSLRDAGCDLHPARPRGLGA